MSKYNSKIEKFIQDNICEGGYNKTYFDAKTNLGNSASPSLYLIAFFYVINFFNYLGIKPNENTINAILKKCREVNKLNIKLSFDGTWDKNIFFDFMKKVLLQINLENICSSKIEDEEEFIQYMISLYEKTVSPNSKVKKALYPLFDDVVGLEKAKLAVKQKVIEPSLHKDIFEKYNVRVGGGILLFGLPGTGKTMFAKSVANEIDGYFINVKSSDIKSKYYGETESRLKEIFNEAQKHDVSVLFFDEFEAIGVSRDKHGGEITAEAIVPELLNQLQGFQKRDNIIMVIAATNRPWDIDSALLRPGRLDTLIYVDLPNADARKLMFSKYLKMINVEEDIIEYLADYTDGYNGSDIKEICDQLIRIVISKEIAFIKNYEITFADCVEVLKDKKSSVSKKDVVNMKIFIDNHDVN